MSELSAISLLHPDAMTATAKMVRHSNALFRHAFELDIRCSPLISGHTRHGMDFDVGYSNFARCNCKEQNERGGTYDARFPK